jgi:hypothetical protein
MRRALERRAQADGRSVSNYIVNLLQKHLETTPEPQTTKLHKFR